MSTIEIEHSSTRTRKLTNDIATILEDSETVDDVWSERTAVKDGSVKIVGAIKFRVENDELLYDVYVVPVADGD
jgi:hypothetical protein